MAKDYISGTFTEDAESSSILVKSTALVFIGGAGGTDLGGGAITVQFKGPDGQWYGSAETISVVDVKSIAVALPCEIRLSLASSTSPDLDYAVLSDVESYRD